MSKRALKPGTFMMTMGMLLIAAALAITAYNIWDSNRAGKASNEILSQMEIPGNVQPASPIMHRTMEGLTQEYPPMAVETINGYDYIGNLEVPSLSLTLPVMADWDYDRLQVSPCVYSGSYFTSDLVICGHNYPTHFSNLKTLPIGAEILLTTVDGYCYRYLVDNIETVQPEEISRMVESTDWDLTLFTCHTGGQTRCALRCSLDPQ